MIVGIPLNVSNDYFITSFIGKYLHEIVFIRSRPKDYQSTVLLRFVNSDH